MRKFIRDNLVLVVGATLPIIVILFFGLATVIPSFFVDPPKYDLLFMTGYAYGQAGFGLNVVNGKLQAEYKCSGYSCNDANNYYQQKLYRFNVKTRNLKEIPLKVPDIQQNTQNQPSASGASQPVSANQPSFSGPVTISETANLQIDPSIKAPDGYQFNSIDTDSGNIFNLLLFSNNRNQVSISKNGSSISIPLTQNRYSYYTVKFIGWIVSEGQQ